ncbi:MAG TPA: hypothetical protein VJS92_03225 [Candidatus Polarisedimenticolaceae bacterium]|nr:hypothetical protein [Candidatus Polarisedimenticolaceae bacterium]
MRRTLSMVTILSALATFAALAAAPPAQLNYQGVLRNAADQPLNGSFDMVLRLYNAPSGGTLLLTDTHSGAGAVSVSGGLFNTQLGGGTITPGSLATLTEVFATQSAVYLEVQVGAETLAPRTRVVSAGYALNADVLDGRDSTAFIDTTSTVQAKAGRIELAGGNWDLSNTDGDFMLGNGTYKFKFGIATGGGGAGDGFIRTRGGTGRMFLGWDGQVPEAPLLTLAPGALGVGMLGPQKQLSVNLGMNIDQSNTNDGALAGPSLTFGSGSGEGILSKRTNGGTQQFGLQFFTNFTPRMLIDNAGRVGIGTLAPGTGTGSLLDVVAGLNGMGVHALTNLVPNGGSEAYMASGTTGIIGRGDSEGGYFYCPNHYGAARIGNLDKGIVAYGGDAAGYFRNQISGHEVWIAGSSGSSPSWGVESYGHYDAGVGYGGGGYFKDTVYGGEAKVGHENYGVQGRGATAGGYFQDTDSGVFAFVGSNLSKIVGSGSVSFVQNHPYEKDKVVVYTAPEAAETATYTRGSARLRNGEARVQLDDTFAWVTNPDVGLTAHVTARAAGATLYVASLSTRELVVRAEGDAKEDVAFDYLVYGLRLGFEQASPVQEKRQEAFIPSMATEEKRYAENPALRRFNALERFKAMREEIGEPSGLDLRASAELRQAVHQYDPATDAVAALPHEAAPPAPRELAPMDEPTARAAVGTAIDPRVELMPVSELVEPGDVLVFDRERPGQLRRGEQAGDPAVAGIVAGEPTEAVAPIALFGVVLCKVDAGYGSIRVGDLLTLSPTPGHAMRAIDAAPGTIVAKAAEPLESGTGLIRVLPLAR